MFFSAPFLVTFQCQPAAEILSSQGSMGCSKTAWSVSKVLVVGRRLSITVVQVGASRVLDLLADTYNQSNAWPAYVIDPWILRLGHGGVGRTSGLAARGRAYSSGRRPRRSTVGRCTWRKGKADCDAGSAHCRSLEGTRAMMKVQVFGGANVASLIPARAIRLLD